MGLLQVAVNPMSRLFDLLAKDGYLPILRTPSVIELMVQGGTYVIISDDTDQGYYQLSYPSFWIESDEHKLADIYDACNDANLNAKLAKCYEMNRTAHCSVQVINSTPDEFHSNFARHVSAIQYATSCFVKKIRASAT